MTTIEQDSTISRLQFYKNTYTSTTQNLNFFYIGERKIRSMSSSNQTLIKQQYTLKMFQQFPHHDPRHPAATVCISRVIKVQQYTRRL